MAEFTGERVIPGTVEPDLWNEHVARYAFATRLSRGKRVLDAGCGTGYGAADLARGALRVVGLDIASESVEYAKSHYPLPNLRFAQASCTAMPFGPAAFDLVVAFEIIEHLKDWTPFLAEIRRVLAPGGQAILSTPNKAYYGASRGETGPNPYHEHEFTFEEFQEEIRKVFPHVSFFLQNHVEGFVFQPVGTFTAADARVDSGGGGPEQSHFFVAVCALVPQTGAPTFVYLPRAANILREREEHIEKLNRQVAEHIREHEKLLGLFRQQEKDLEESNHWAEKLNERLEEAGAQIRRLESEMEALQKQGQRLAAELEDKCKELAGCVDVLHQTEKTVEERTQWALDLRKEIQSLEIQLSRFRASRWVKIGKTFGVGPDVRNG